MLLPRMRQPEFGLFSQVEKRLFALLNLSDHTHEYLSMGPIRRLRTDPSFRTALTTLSFQSWYSLTKG